MDAKEDSYFIIKLFEFVLRINGKPLPCHLQRRLDKYAIKEDNYLTKTIKKAVMININDYLLTKKTRQDVASRIYEAKMHELWKDYTLGNFLEFLSLYAYETVLDFIDNNAEAPEAFFKSVMYFIKNLRAKERFDNKSWKMMNQSATTLIEEKFEKSDFPPLRQSRAEPDLTEEKGFVLMVMHYVYQYSCRTLPPYLQKEFDKYELLPDPKIKNAVYVIMIDLGKKIELLGEIEPIVLFYYNLCSHHFNEKYFLVFCVCCARKAILEYFEESIDDAPMSAFRIPLHMLALAKEDGKYSSLEDVDDAATKIIEEDRDRVEHERKRREISVEDSSESAIHPTESGEILLDSDQKDDNGCKIRCCALN